MVIVEKPGYLTVSHDPAKNFILFDWESFNIPLKDIKDAHAQAQSAMVKKRCYNFVADTSKVRQALSQEIISWWEKTQFPNYVKSGLKSIVTVLPASAIANLSTKAWQSSTVNGIYIKNVKSRDEAASEIRKLR